MPSEWRWYLGDRDHYLRDKADELAGQLRAAASNERRERAQLARQQGSLEQRLDRLTTDFGRLLELTDLRFELDVFAEHEALRRRVRAYLTSLEVLGAPPRAGGARSRLDDGGGATAEWYWLAPLARALPLIMAGDEPELDLPDLEQARRLDQPRTDRFLVLLLALAGRGRHAAGLLGPALGPVDGSLTRLQRALWRAAAAGVLGDEGRDQLGRWLADMIAAAPAGTVDSATDQWREAAVAGLGTPIGLPPSLSRDDRAAYDSLLGPLAAARVLIAVAERHRSAAAAVSEPAAPEPAAPEPAAPAPAAVDPEPGDAAGTAGQELRWALMALVDEGSEDEAPLLRRVEQLRHLLGDHGADPGAAGDPDAPAGSPIEALLGDALGAPQALGTPLGSGDAPAAAVAWRVAGSWLGSLRGPLEDRAATLPAVPPPIVLEIGEGTVTVTGEPFPPGVVERLADAAAERAYPQPEGLLSRIRSDDDVEARHRYRQRLIDRAGETGAALASVREELATLAGEVARARGDLDRAASPIG